MSQIRVKGAKAAGLDACRRVVRAFRKAQPEQTVGDGDLFASNSVFVIVIIVSMCRLNGFKQNVSTVFPMAFRQGQRQGFGVAGIRKFNQSLPVLPVLSLEILKFPSSEYNGKAWSLR